MAALGSLWSSRERRNQGWCELLGIFLPAKAAEGWEVLGTVSNPEDAENIPVISCSEFQWNKPVIIVIGSEGDGLSLETQLLCHRMLAIPPGRALHPGIESLNVSVATGILLHSICSQKLRHALPSGGKRNQEFLFFQGTFLSMVDLILLGAGLPQHHHPADGMGSRVRVPSFADILVEAKLNY
uniref:tRNA/rRNA methyltransferase SpoU type domain-containing protein n=1 Tax=Melopsittacus undulatus TaxID=13146 RepID=A0A8V5H200_MELUD